MNTDVKDKVYNIILEAYNFEHDYKDNIDITKITDDMLLYNNLGLSSLTIMETIMEIETVFNISLSDDEILKLKTVGDIINIISIKLIK